MKEIALIIGLSPLLIVLTVLWLRFTREGIWVAALIRDWGEVLKRKRPNDGSDQA
jgi:hypothetical protein